MIYFRGQQTTDNRQRTTDNRQRTTDNGQGTTDNRQLTTDNARANERNKSSLLISQRMQPSINEVNGQRTTESTER